MTSQHDRRLAVSGMKDHQIGSYAGGNLRKLRRVDVRGIYTTPFEIISRYDTILCATADFKVFSCAPSALVTILRFAAKSSKSSKYCAGIFTAMYIIIDQIKTTTLSSD